MAVSDGLPIGLLAERTGLAVSAIRYYEEQGLIRPWRNAGGQRRFGRADIRRLSFVMIAQKVGLTLPELRELLATLPGGRAPNKRDWDRVAAAFQAHLDARIAELAALRDSLGSCIGCGCLSLPSCALYNPKDRIAAKVAGPRFLLGDAYEPAR